MMRRALVLPLVIALMASGCSTRDTVDNQLWHDQHPVLSTTIECSVFCAEMLVNAVLSSAALLLSGK
jgi:hypothetical protein